MLPLGCDKLLGLLGRQEPVFACSPFLMCCVPCWFPGPWCWLGVGGG